MKMTQEEKANYLQQMRIPGVSDNETLWFIAGKIKSWSDLYNIIDEFATASCSIEIIVQKTAHHNLLISTPFPRDSIAHMVLRHALS
ncbi:hypothetical protein HF670_15400 [Acidithiobacillus thiooxidans]|jgi:hypothetical protein|uniref:hypothetical protein n=1 Tax=Acidithiobacillus TaxID=119977 RepID=UPI0004E148F3|nr:MULTISPECIES: hypothetical protein [Acidithiobacillus]MBE7566679.1 hypothetical protein [Acidithiobacillus sp. HP-11]MBU2749548.1 hypothetical protein [Acidithiobacillus thiooxidans]MBU2793599.1 hypothetical protein [Acidithiobacillus thiooxidans]MBU2836295.1 hypothetical protein [Acidithiobacillus thiooxidans]MBU2840884.1 hypothetical protein [Acidithiobacillus thiooxidans]